MPEIAKLNVVSENPRLVDRQLVHRCLAGEPQAERALYDAHVERVYRLVHRMAGDADLAADFTQETFIRAFDRLAARRSQASRRGRQRSVATRSQLE
jgi:RNA polymerase sigma-70 factor (ECF subfamily)